MNISLLFIAVNHLVFGAVLLKDGATPAEVVLLVVAAACLGYSISGPLLRHFVSRFMLGAKGEQVAYAYSTLAPVLINAFAACVIWVVWHVF